MGKELVMSKKQMDVLSGVTYTGHDLEDSKNYLYPPTISILSSDKQYKAFGEDANKITISDYGKVFIRSERNKIDDLKESIQGTILKIEHGYEVRQYNSETEKEDLLYSGSGYIQKEEKERLIAEGKKPKNMVKLLIAPYNFEETTAMLNRINDKRKAGVEVLKSDYPFAVLAIKGISFGTWFDTEGQMRYIAQEVVKRPLKDIPSSFFYLDISTEIEESPKFGDMRRFELNVSLNDPEESVKFLPVMNDMREFSMFYKVADRVNHDVDLDGEVEVEEAEIVSTDELDEILG